MKNLKIILIAITMLLTVSYATGEKKHWQVIKQFLEEDTPEAGVQYREYMESLSLDELMTAARQCSDEIELSTDPNNWDMASMALDFFWRYYPVKTNNLKDISLLLNDLRDKKQSPFWRNSIMYLLESSKWRQLLSSEQRLDAAKIMYEIYSDDSENVLLKPKAIRKSTELLRAVYSVNLENESNVAIKANEKVLVEINNSIMTQMSLFSNKATDPAIQESIIVVWARYHESDLAPPQVSQTLANAVEDYKDYDESLWKLLVKTNIESFGNRTAETKLQDMINDANDKTNKEHLIYLNKELEKKAKKEKLTQPDPNV